MSEQPIGDKIPEPVRPIVQRMVKTLLDNVVNLVLVAIAAGVVTLTTWLSNQNLIKIEEELQKQTVVMQKTTLELEKQNAILGLE